MASKSIPGAYIRDELERRGWSQRDLAQIIGRPYQMINELIQGKRAILPDMAIMLGTVFGTGPDIWMQREAEYQLAQSAADTGPVERRVKLFEMAPIKEMEKRQWISSTSAVEETEREICSFFDILSINEEPHIGAATRKSDTSEPLTPSQRAWCFRVKQIAKAKRVAEYREDQLDSCIRELRTVAAYPQETHKVSGVLEAHGIRFVVVEPLPSCKVDGVAMWLDGSSPAIGMSLRYDRVDSFWFTLCHELSHIKHKDEAPLDSDLTDYASTVMMVKDSMERRADEEATDMLLPNQELESFVLRIGPLYSKESIIRFAHRMKIHPGIIVGQLQHRHEIGYHANREMLAKVRQVVIPVATTDGWGNFIDPRNLQ
jgi:HTH-type transcriptional regulator / antitoxin HigA